jgi:predicted metal-dependent HD superfamily phosphohydrolase
MSIKASEATIEIFWNEIESHYTGKHRHYHTLSHLENMLRELKEVQSDITDWPVILFSLYYHDIIYDVRKQDNEQKSADIAEQRMRTLGIPKKKIEKCREQIIATRSHKLSEDSDTNYFLDADLSVLGSPREEYEKYCHDIRKEFRLYPDILYKRGREKVIRKLISMDRIYKTSHFYGKYEVQARENLHWELKNL